MSSPRFFFNFKNERLPSGQERSLIIHSCFNYIVAIGRGLIHVRFPELHFVLIHLSQVNPTLKTKCSTSINDVIKRFDNIFDARALDRQFKKYRYDKLFSEFFEEDGQMNVTKVWCHILKNMGQEYGDPARLAILIMCLSPDNMESDRKVSVLNLVKTKQRNKLREDTLNADMGIGMDKKSASEIVSTRHPPVNNSFKMWFNPSGLTSWSTMVFIIPWSCTMDNHGLAPWTTMVLHHRQPWSCTMDNHHLAPWTTMVSPWLTVVPYPNHG